MGVICIESNEQFQRDLGNGFAVIDFWAQFCGPCRRIAPDYEALSNKYKDVKFFKCNTKEDGPDEVAGIHRIRALPTFVFYRNRKEIAELRFEGANMEKLEQTIVKHGTTPSFTGSGNSTGAGNSITFEAPLLGDQLEPLPNPITVDQSKPKTRLQFRMANGKKLIQEFNHDHMVSDVFMYVGAQDGFSSNFIIKSGFPPRQVSDNGEDIKTAKLLNSVILQQLA